jgi:hypothetical protein
VPPNTRQNSPLFKLGIVFVRFDQVASFIVNADHGMVGVLKNLAYLTTLATPFGPPVK